MDIKIDYVYLIGGNIRVEFSQEFTSYRGKKKERVRGTSIYYGKVLVPKEVVILGEVAINEWVRKYAKEDIKNKRVASLRKLRKIRRIKIPLSVVHEDVVIAGCVCWSRNEDHFAIRIESPLEGEKYWGYGYGFASAMAGIRKFDENNNLTKEALIDAQRSLIKLYIEIRDRLANQTTLDLVDRLNKP